MPAHTAPAGTELPAPASRTRPRAARGAAAPRAPRRANRPTRRCSPQRTARCNSRNSRDWSRNNRMQGRGLHAEGPDEPHGEGRGAGGERRRRERDIGREGPCHRRSTERRQARRERPPRDIDEGEHQQRRREPKRPDAEQAQMPIEQQPFSKSQPLDALRYGGGRRGIDALREHDRQGPMKRLNARIGTPSRSALSLRKAHAPWRSAAAGVK